MRIATVIGNPKAGRGRAGEGWDELLAELRAGGYDVSGRLTAGPGHACELAADARTGGSSLVVAVGGDGTVHEVVNGLLSADGTMPELGIVALGSGCDYVKTFGIPPGYEGAGRRLTSGAEPMIVDAAEVRYEGGRRFFCNIAEVGIGAEVVERATRLPRFLGGAMYFFGFWLTLPTFERRRARVRIDGEGHDVLMTNLVVALGTTYGGGMRIAPDADPSDGLFDVQVHAGSKLDYVKGIPKVYRGTHIPHPRITQERGATIEVSCEPPGTIEADGEVIGTTPATFRVLPGALRLKVGEVR